jgi:hypothetical protein
MSTAKIANLCNSRCVSMILERLSTRTARSWLRHVIKTGEGRRRPQTRVTSSPRWSVRCCCCFCCQLWRPPIGPLCTNPSVPHATPRAAGHSIVARDIITLALANVVQFAPLVKEVSATMRLFLPCRNHPRTRLSSLADRIWIVSSGAIFLPR